MNIDLAHVVILSLAVYRITRLIVEDIVLEKARNLVWSKFPHTHGLGYLITCYWCTSFWVSSLIVIAYTIVPVAVVAVGLVMALSAITGLIAAWLEK
jgi:hypothetical protein